MIPVPMDPADATLCDAVLVTHEHLDHMHPPSLDPLLEDGGAAYAPPASFENYDYEGPLSLPPDRRTVVEPGDRFEVGDLTVSVRAAHDPDAVDPVTYVVEHASGTFFHGGDTKPSDSFEALGDEFDIDLGVLAMGSDGRIAGEYTPVNWYMGPNEVVEAAAALELDRLAPSHWDMWRGVEGDPSALADHAASFAYPRVIEPIRIGDRLDVDDPGVIPPSSLG